MRTPRTLFRWSLRATITVVLLLLLLPTAAFAATHGTGFAPSVQTWALILGAVTPLLTYVLNHYAPWMSEATKAIVLVGVAGVVGAVWTAIQTSVFGWNDATVQLVLTAILGAFGAHALLWRPATISAKLGGGSNAARTGS